MLGNYIFYYVHHKNDCKAIILGINNFLYITLWTNNLNYLSQRHSCQTTRDTLLFKTCSQLCDQQKIVDLNVVSDRTKMWDCGY